MALNGLRRNNNLWLTGKTISRGKIEELEQVRKNYGSSTVNDALEKMISEGTLMLLPTSDIRGFDTSGMHAGIYVTEAQNTSIDIYRKRKREYERMEKNVTEAFLDISVSDSNTKISEQEIIDKINELPDKYQQMSLFDI